MSVAHVSEFYKKEIDDTFASEEVLVIASRLASV